MFDQANPDTPNDVIVEEMRRQKPDLVGLSFLSTTSYPYAKMLARQLRAADSNVKLAFGGVFATLNAPARQAAVPGGRLRLPRRRRAAHPRPARAVGRSRRRDGRDLAEGRQAPQQPQPGARAQPRPVAIPRPREPAARFRGVDAARRPRGPLAATASRRCRRRAAARGPASSATSRSSTRASGARAAPQHVLAEFKQLQKHGYGAVYFVDDHFLLQPKRIEAICDGHHRREASRSSGAARGASTRSRSTSSPPWRRRTAGRSCSASRAAARRSSTA